MKAIYWICRPAQHYLMSQARGSTDLC